VTEQVQVVSGGDTQFTQKQTKQTPPQVSCDTRVEEWRSVVNPAGSSYMVSSLGRVRNSRGAISPQSGGARYPKVDVVVESVRHAAAIIHLLAAVIIAGSVWAISARAGAAAPVKSERPEISDRRWIAIAQAEPARDADLAIVGDSIVALGDWQAMLGRPVAKVGVCGGRTTDLAECIKATARPGRTVVIAAGINDIVDGQGSPAEIAARVVALAEQAREVGASPLVSLPLMLAAEPVTERVVMRKGVAERVADTWGRDRRAEINARVAELRVVLARLCANAAIPTVDAGPALAPDGVLIPTCTVDGLHLTPAGYKLLGEAVRAALVAD